MNDRTISTRDMRLTRYPDAVSTIKEPDIIDAVKICFYILTKHAESQGANPLLDITITDTYISVYVMGWEKYIPTEVFLDLWIINKERDWDGIIGQVRFYLTHRHSSSEAKNGLLNKDVFEVRVIPKKYRHPSTETIASYQTTMAHFLLDEQQQRPGIDATTTTTTTPSNRQSWLGVIKDPIDHGVINHVMTMIAHWKPLRYPLVASLVFRIDSTHRDYYQVIVENWDVPLSDELVYYLYHANDKTRFPGEPIKAVYIDLPLPSSSAASYNLVVHVHRNANTLIKTTHLEKMTSNFVASSSGRGGGSCRVKRRIDDLDLDNDLCESGNAPLVTSKKRRHHRILLGNSLDLCGI